MSYESSGEGRKIIKKHAIIQFLKLFEAHKDIEIPLSDLKWGDETEYHLITFEGEGEELSPKVNNNTIQIQNEILAHPQYEEAKVFPCLEMGAWILELIPDQPFTLNEDCISQLDLVLNKRYVYIVYSIYIYRRVFVNWILKAKKMEMVTIGAYPLLGTKDCAIDGLQGREFPLMAEKESPATLSRMVSDKLIGPSPKYFMMLKNMRLRRGFQLSIQVPLFMDTETDPSPSLLEPNSGFITMDTDLFPMGFCSQQYTYESCSLNHGLYLHDQLHVFSPIFGALSASSPIHKGKLSELDCIYFLAFHGLSFDDRTSEETDINSREYIYQRYSISNHYLSSHEYAMVESLNDGDFPVPPINPRQIELQSEFEDLGIPKRMALHYSSIFTREPLYFMECDIKRGSWDDDTTIKHFAQFQQAMWPDIRFKPQMSVQGSMGYRVEVRSIESQITDIENAAFGAFCALLVGMLTQFDVNFLMPITQIQANMELANDRDAILRHSFLWRANNITQVDYTKSELQSMDFLSNGHLGEKEVVVEMSIREILEGKEDVGYKGVIPLLREYMEFKGYNTKAKEKIDRYLEILVLRGRGIYKTNARFLRDRVLDHPLYAHDSIMTKPIATDIFKEIIALGNNPNPDLDIYFHKQTTS